MKDYLEQYRVPGLEAREMFEPPVDELDEAIAVGREWNEVTLADFAAVELMTQQECDPDLALEPTNEHWADYQELLRLRQVEKRAQQAQTRIKLRLQLHMDRASSLGLVATWKHHYEARFDKDGYVRTYPQVAPLVEEFTTQKLVRRFSPRW